MDAIVYTSNCGHTQQYAQMLAEETGLRAYSLKEAKKLVKQNSEIIYLGWMMAGKISGLEKAKALYQIKAICGVGMSAPAELSEKLSQSNATNEVKRYYFQGGIDVSKLKGIKKIMIKMMSKGLTESLENKMNKTEDEIKTLEMFKNNTNCVARENLDDIIAWYHSIK